MKLWLVIVIITFLSQTAMGEVLEIEEMKISVFVTDNAHMKYEIKLKNKIDKPIVPGVFEMRLQKVENLKFFFLSIPSGYEKPVEIENLRAYSGNMNFKTSVEHLKNYTSLYYEIWYPIEPYGTMDVTLEFDADLVDHGFIFKSITIPIGGDTDIRRIEFEINSDWKLCYLEGKVKSLPANHIAFITAEFSLLPLPLLHFRAYVIFWTSLIILIAMIGYLVLRRK